MNCEHKNIVRIAGGWFCLDCKQLFDQKPLPPKEEKPKKKGAKK